VTVVRFLIPLQSRGHDATLAPELFNFSDVVPTLPKPVRVGHPQVSLGTRVKIVDNGGKGKVVIEYRNLEDFDRIIETLGK
jgi:hypothetical protein